MHRFPTIKQQHVSLSSRTQLGKRLEEQLEETLTLLTPTPFAGAQGSPGRSRLTGTPDAHPATPGFRWPRLTLKLRLDFPGAGGKPTEHVAVVVLEEQQAGPAVGDAPTELGEAVPVELGREEQVPAVLPLPGQVGVDVDDRQEVQDAVKLLPLVNLPLGDQRGQIEGPGQAKGPVDDHAQERGHQVGPEHPVLDHGRVAVTGQLLRPQQLLAV